MKLIVDLPIKTKCPCFANFNFFDTDKYSLNTFSAFSFFLILFCSLFSELKVR